MSNLEYFVVGTYTHYVDNAPFACGDGITIISLNRETGALKSVNKLSGIKNPTYLYWLKEQNRLFASCEDNDATFYSIEINNNQMSIKDKSFESKAPLCHITGLKNNIYTVSYNNGSLHKFKISENGHIKHLSNYFYKGSGPNISRQESSHAHQVLFSPNKMFYYVCDLGVDKIWIHNAKNDEIIGELKVPPGYGPRHLVFDISKDYVYLVNELTPVLMVLKVDNTTGLLKIIQEIPIFNEEQTTAPAAIKVHPSGNSVVVSSRFDDQIIIFPIIRTNEGSINIKKPINISSGGKTPRDITFSINGDWLLIANQDSSNIKTHEFNLETGLPRGIVSSPFNIGTPVCIIKLN